MQARIELAGGDERVRRAARRVLRLRRRPGEAGRRAARASRSWPPATRSTGSRVSTTSRTWRRPGPTTTLGRPDRTAEVVHAVVHNQFGLGRGGLPGNDDSGGLSSWYVWASARAVPGRRAEPLPDQRPVVRPRPAGPRRSRAGHRRPGLRRARARRSAPVRPVGPVQRPAAGAVAGCPLAICTAAVSCEITLGPQPSGWSRDHRPPSVTEPGPSIPGVSSAPLPVEVTA